ncbi:auxin-induced in root cultures protein 12 [Cucumis melo]|uniref:Auxin-induced in root cultures protein 12 n=1 Tax=Cucumis melo TaxID=3656 RepID=A0A1S4E1W3_CUCME|nr:auxin-induced in root cultures protein 12 [Cucumis melo]
MASFSNFFLLLTLISSSLSISHSLTCSSQSFPDRTFTNCQDLPYLNAFLHWSYNPTNSSLSIAFLAPPPTTAGWVAWAVNPTATGMAGSQAFLAAFFAKSLTVRTFNITSYNSVRPSPTLSFPFWDLASESSDDLFAIFVTVKVPEKASSLNQVWQVGPSVDSSTGVPAAHEFKSDNLKSRGVLVFEGSAGAPSPAPRPDHGGASTATSPSVVGGVNETAAAPTPKASGPDKGGVPGIKRRNLGCVVLSWFVFAVWGIFSF